MSQHNDELLNMKGLSAIVKGQQVAIIATEWNHAIVTEQIAGAARIAAELGIAMDLQFIVPGSVELVYAIQKLIQQNEDADLGIKAIIAFGAVIRGGTPHFEYVCQMVSDGINHINLEARLPVIFGVLTVNDEAQAWDRLGGEHGHKGEEAMMAAAKMIAYEEALGFII